MSHNFKRVMGLLDDCEAHFGSDDLFKILEIDRDASESKIKKAYYKQSLKFHPDKSNESNLALNTQKFQCLSKIHKILSDKKTREAYIEHGDVDEGGFINENVEWVEYWRNLYPKITLKTIDDYKIKYQNSDQEIEDLIKAYNKYKGDMNKIMDEIPCATNDDEPRFRDLIKLKIQAKELKPYKAFKSSNTKLKVSERKRKADVEADEAVQHAADLGISLPGSSSGLADMILARQKDRNTDSMLDALAAKYAKPAKKTRKKKAT
jgi:DnaJ family protein C protein 9